MIVRVDENETGQVDRKEERRGERGERRVREGGEGEIMGILQKEK